MKMFNKQSTIRISYKTSRPSGGPPPPPIPRPKWSKWTFFSQNDQFLAKNGQKVENENFHQNPKRHKSKFYGCPTSCKKPEKNYSLVLAAEPERTHGLTDGGEFKGSFPSLKTPENQKGFQSKLGQMVQEMLILGYFWWFYTTRPPEMTKSWSHGPAWQTKILKKYSTKNISYKTSRPSGGPPPPPTLRPMRFL